MNKTQFIILIFFSGMHFCNVFSQKSLDEQPDYSLGSGLYFIPTQLFFQQIAFSYEHFIQENISMNYSFGYKIPTAKEGDEYKPGDERFSANFSITEKAFHGIDIAIAPAFYFNQKKNIYVQLEIYDRFFWMNNKYLLVERAGLFSSDYSAVRNDRNNILGFRGLFGVNAKIDFPNSKILYNIKLYAGIGVRYSWYSLENVGGTGFDESGNEIPIPYIAKKTSYMNSFPALNAGVKIGIAKKGRKLF